MGILFALFPQAPSNMKSVLQAGWLLTVAVGNIIVLIVAGAGQFNEQVRGGKGGVPLSYLPVVITISRPSHLHIHGHLS